MGSHHTTNNRRKVMILRGQKSACELFYSDLGGRALKLHE